MSFDEFSITENQIKIEPENQAKNNGKIPNLVKYAKSSADDLPPSHINQGLEALQNFQKEYRVERYYAQNLGARLLYAHAKSIIGDDKELCQKYHRTITCMRRQIGCKHKIHRSIAHNKAFYSGLETCCNVWVCPVCAAKIQSRRTIEVQDLYQWAYQKQGKQIVMVTLTYPHALGDELNGSLEKHAEALVIFRKFNNAKFKKFKDAIGYFGLVRALEITHGKNGWHPHTHELWVMDAFDADPAKEQEIRQFILDRWEHACKKAGLLDKGKTRAFREHAIDIKFRTNDSEYLTKQNAANEKTWGTDKEVACSNSKLGKEKGKAPFQILLESEQDSSCGELFLEYAVAMKGKAQLFWTPGLKGKVGIIEKSDEELANEQEDFADLLAILNREHWLCVVKNNARAEILDIAETGGIEGLQQWFADYGLALDKPTDEEYAEDQRINDKIRADKAEKLAKREKRRKVQKP